MAWGRLKSLPSTQVPVLTSNSPACAPAVFTHKLRTCSLHFAEVTYIRSVRASGASARQRKCRYKSILHEPCRHKMAQATHCGWKVPSFSLPLFMINKILGESQLCCMLRAGGTEIHSELPHGLDSILKMYCPTCRLVLLCIDPDGTSRPCVTVHIL